MAPRASGQVVKPSGRRRSFSLRFRAYGKRWVIKLGRPEDGWPMQITERELAVVLRDVDLRTWRPPRPEPAPSTDVDPTFHEFASDSYATKELEVEPNTANHYRNDLTNHLLPFFKDHHLSQITVAEVDRYRQHKVREAAEIAAAAESGKPMTVSYLDRLGRRYRRHARPLSPRSINTVGAAPGRSARRCRRPADARRSPRCSSAVGGRRRPERCCGATSTSPTVGSR